MIVGNSNSITISVGSKKNNTDGITNGSARRKKIPATKLPTKYFRL
jgi:hypothetical protein